MHRKIVYFFLILSLMPALIMAGTKGRIKGKVVDFQTGEPLINANVIIVGTNYGASTDVNGEYVIMNLDAGAYEIKASYIGYRPATFTNVRVNADLTTEQNFELKSEDISTEAVVVVAKKALIKKDATSSIRIASRDDFKNLPVRGVNSVALLQAGVNYSGGIRIRGSRTDEVGYYLDGVNITDPMGGGRMVSIPSDAVEEVAVETGGFSAEYGGANAGIIRTQLRTGGKDYNASVEYYTDNITLQSSDDFYNQEERLGGYWHGRHVSSFVIGGPIINKNFRFFYNLEYAYRRTGANNDFGAIDLGLVADPTNKDTVDISYPAGVFKNDQSQSWSHAGTITMNFNPISIRLSGTYSKSWSQDGSKSITAKDRDRSLDINSDNGNFSLKVTHVLTPEMFYEITGGYSFGNYERTDQYMGDNFWEYGDSVANANAGAVWARSEKDLRIKGRHGRYYHSGDFKVYDWEFAPKNSFPSSRPYYKSNRRSIFLKADFSLLANKHHTIKIGGDYHQYTRRFWSVGSQTSLAGDVSRLDSNFTQTQLDSAKASMLRRRAINNLGYDVWGNEVDDDGLFGPRKPVFASFYIQDKIEYSDIILNIGLRYDYIDVDNWEFKDLTRPELAITSVAANGEFIMDGWEKASTFSSLTPRIGISFPITDKTVFHAGFGKYIQQPDLSKIYIGPHYWQYQIGGGYFFSNPGAMRIKPTRKTHYEIGFKQELTDFMAVDISAYYDDIKDQMQFKRIVTNKEYSPYSDYDIQGNSDFATNKGVEITLNMRRYQRIAVNASLTFSDAKGTNPSPTATSGIIGSPLDGVTAYTPKYVAPLSYNRPFMGNISFDYRFGVDDGPAFFHQLGINLLATFNGGHPYTRIANTPGDLSDGRSRLAIEAPGASMTPSQFMLDLKIDKTFTIWDQLSANIYLRINNVLDLRNVTGLYARTSSPDDDGYITNPETGGQLVKTYGETYKKIYDAFYTNRNSNYSNPREILFGIRLEY